MNDQNTTDEVRNDYAPAEAEAGEKSLLTSREAPESNADQDAPDQDEDTGQDDPQDDGGKLRKIRKEAATYRQRARDAETERDTLKERVEALEWREVQRHIPKGAPKLEALKKLGLELDEVRDDAGDIDPVKVSTVVEAAAEMVGVSLNAAPRMPLEGKAPASQAIPADVASSLQKALTGK